MFTSKIYLNNILIRKNYETKIKNSHFKFCITSAGLNKIITFIHT